MKLQNSFNPVPVRSQASIGLARTSESSLSSSEANEEDLAAAYYADHHEPESSKGPHWGGLLPGAFYGLALGGVSCLGGSSLAKSTMIEAGVMGAVGSVYGGATDSAVKGALGGALAGSLHGLAGWAVGQAMGGSIPAQLVGDALVGAVAGMFLFSDGQA